MQGCEFKGSLVQIVRPYHKAGDLAQCHWQPGCYPNFQNQTRNRLLSGSVIVQFDMVSWASCTLGQVRVLTHDRLFTWAWGVTAAGIPALLALVLVVPSGPLAPLSQLPPPRHCFSLFSHVLSRHSSYTKFPSFPPRVRLLFSVLKRCCSCHFLYSSQDLVCGGVWEGLSCDDEKLIHVRSQPRLLLDSKCRAVHYMTEAFIFLKSICDALLKYFQPCYEQ